MAVCMNEHCDYGKDCSAYTECVAYKPRITNADRIRAMSDEELATMFYGMCCGMELCDGCIAVNDCPGENANWWYNWLRQPVKDGDNDG